MNSDDPDILAFGSMPSPDPGRSFGADGPDGSARHGGGQGGRRRSGALRRIRRVALPAAGAAGLAVAGLALTSIGATQPHHTPASHSAPAVTVKFQPGVSGFLRAELPAVRLSTGQTVPLRTVATTRCHHQ